MLKKKKEQRRSHRRNLEQQSAQSYQATQGAAPTYQASGAPVHRGSHGSSHGAWGAKGVTGDVVA